jgi:hypothetical protein
VLHLVRLDLDGRPIPKEDEPRPLYLFAPHLASGSGLADPERAAYRTALDELAGHLRRGDRPRFRWLDADRTLCAVDLAADSPSPGRLLASYPYGLMFDQNDTSRREDELVRAYTGRVAHVRADWFVRVVTTRLTAGDTLFGAAGAPPRAVRDWAAAWAAGDVTLPAAAVELGADVDRVRLAIRTHDPLRDKFRLGPLAEGKSVPRAAWESCEFAVSGFQELARELRVGTPVVTD